MSASENYRNLTEHEIETLEMRGCRAEDWFRVYVDRNFKPGSCRNVRFSGDIRLGIFEGTLTSPGGVEQRRGIFDAALHNCTVGDNARIVSVTRYIANYDIGRGAVIEDIGTLAVDRETAFGNGTRVNVMIETGARNIPIFDRLSSQIAHLLTFERHRSDALEALEKLVADYVRGVTSTRGEIGPGAHIIDCQRITNVKIGASARVIGAVELENGSINSTAADPARVGSGVIARDFIFASGSVVDSGAQVQQSFVGQGAQIGEQFLAEHSLFFSNAACYKGEACSIFAGPFTTTHHKSTLLLTALYSFYNAGSGTNFSNHRYKLGPVHQGVLERGCKSGSSSYMIWPGRVGAFSLIVGKHFKGVDTSAFPFSYVLQDGDKTVLLPGANLFTIGVLRDGKKWGDRDRRKDQELLDLYRTDVFGPYTIGRMIRGRDTLAKLELETSKDQERVCWNGAEIPRERIKRGWLDYSLAVFCFLGRKVSMAAEAIIELSGTDNIEQKIVSTKSWGLGEWSDLGGMMMPGARIGLLLDDVQSGKIENVAALEKSFKSLHEAYPQMEWNWVLTTWLSEIDKDRSEVDLSDIVETIAAWRDALGKRFEKVRNDAAKEFSEKMRYGYGLDGDATIAHADFAAVRGNLENDPFFKAFKEETDRDIARADKLLDKLG